MFEGARDDKVGIYRGTKNLVATTTENYRGRFLLELIQNGFDAHPEGTSSGRIGVTFMEDEGPHGVLYVANGGRPLSRSNFERMSSLGDSDKKRGEGIGNKGVGFKSVFQVCDRPEVYSARDGSDPGFAGYSFRFGELADLDAFVDGDKTLRNRIEKNLSLSLLTVPLDTVPPTVTRMRREGYVTVLRLPLASKVAAEEVSERIASIASSRSPVMLFLDRLEHLTIRQAANAKPLVLTRHESADSGIKHVVLNGSERYLMFERQVAPDQLAAALKKSVDEKLLDEKWLEWTAPARVSIAVGDGWEIAEPSPFTFLPMADDARSPLGGHINAPFVTDYARLTLDLKNHVNRLLMHEIASLCVESAQTLARERRNANAVVDLLAWDRGHGDWVDKAARAQARLAPHDLMCLPVRGDENWHPSSSLSTWPGDGCSVITVERVVDSAGARMIDTDQVSARRIARLEQSMPAGRSLAPHPELLADWVETVADCLGRDAAAVETWQRFYDDLPLLFSDGAPLAGKSILLTESGHIVAADGSAHPTASQSSRARGRQRAVFFAPKAAGTEDDDAIELEADVRISTPAPLARRIDFLHPDLNWHVGRQQTPGRKFLQDNRLAQQFRTASLLSHLAQMMDARPSKEVKRAALQFAFQLFAANPTRHAKELRLAGLFVPNLEGEWIRADGAHFSRGWKIEGADDLSDLADAARESDSELAALTSRLIAPPERVGGQRVKPARWLQFLRAIGVTVSLPILEATDPRRLLGRSLRGESLAGKGAPSALPPAVVEQWKSGISTAGNWNHPETDFTAKSPLYWLMGQGECDALPVVLRSAYARLALMTVPLLSDEHRRTTWRRQRPGGITTDVETPLWAHLKHSAWVPVQQPGGGPADFLTPAETWNATIEHREAPVSL